MLDTFITSFRLKNTYRTNTIIYSIRCLPIIGKLLPASLYGSGGLKTFANVISVLWEIAGTFIGKILYMLLMIMLMLAVYDTEPSDTYLHIFTALTVAGGLTNTYMFNPTKDKYYAIVIMGMDARKFAISNYCYSMIKVVVGFLPLTIILGWFLGVPLWTSVLMPFFVVAVKMTFIAYDIWKFRAKGIATSENMLGKASWIGLGVLLIIAYGPPFLGLSMNLTVFTAAMAVSFALGIAGLISISRFSDYRRLYRLLLTTDNVFALKKATGTEALKESFAKKIEYDGSFTSSKQGFAYFHQLFVKRHGKLLTKSVKKQAYVITGAAVLAIAVSIARPEFNPILNRITLTYLPYFVFIMYLLNRGTTITQAMFMNCDHSMLTYRFYRTPKVILGMFRERLKTLILLNLLPSSLLGLGLAALLYTTGGTDNPLNYAVLFVSVNAISVFFSVHYLVMYYLLQPYTRETKVKNSTYIVVQYLTYGICFAMMYVHLPTLSFGIATIIFSVAYCAVSLMLIYRLAPKTFRIRMG